MRPGCPSLVLRLPALLAAQTAGDGEDWLKKTLEKPEVVRTSPQV
jgi:hypothetical protein